MSHSKTARPKSFHITVGGRQSGVTSKLLRLTAKQASSKRMSMSREAESFPFICYFAANTDLAKLVENALQLALTPAALSVVQVFTSSRPLAVERHLRELRNEGVIPSFCIVDDCRLEDLAEFTELVLATPATTFWELGVTTDNPSFL